MARILIVDDEESICWALERLLSGEGHSCRAAASAEAALEAAAEEGFGLVLLDVRLPGMDGLAALPKLREAVAGAPVVVMTAHGSMQTAVEAMKGGAFDYVTKPLDLERTKLVVARAFERARLDAEVSRLRSEIALAGSAELSSLVGNSPAMQEVYKKIGALAGADATVLIVGESGTGKELVARAIHYNSPRAERPFVPVNCAALPEELLASELFGHVRGSFTGAIRDRAGKFEAAAGGTIFLDEVAEMPESMQLKLLRVLEERRFERVGSTEAVEADVRILAATHRDLRARVAAGRFREDLLFRLDVVALQIPPVRERAEDVPLLVAHFLARAGRVSGRGAAPEMSAEAMKLLSRCRWPGNVRELRNAIEHAVTLVLGETILPEHLPAHVAAPASASAAAADFGELSRAADRPAGDEATDAFERAVRERVRERLAAGGEPADLHAGLTAEMERPLIEEVYRACDGNQVRTAQLLGIHRTTLRKKLEEYGIGR